MFLLPTLGARLSNETSNFRVGTQNSGACAVLRAGYPGKVVLDRVGGVVGLEAVEDLGVEVDEALPRLPNLAAKRRRSTWFEAMKELGWKPWQLGRRVGGGSSVAGPCSPAAAPPPPADTDSEESSWELDKQ